MNFEATFLLAILAAFILGMAKAGFKGLGFAVVTLMALAYEAKASTGILMPLLIFADCIAIYVYRHAVRWDHFWKLIPWMAVGVLVGVIIGDAISELIFKRMMAVIILFSGIMMLLFEFLDKDYVPKSRWFSSFMGLAAGVTTMIGNLAGAFSNLYFLAMRFPKKEFIGTAAWVFFAINLFKLPFHIFFWKTVTWSSLKIGLWLIPFVLLGLLAGLKGVQYFSESMFKRYIIIITILGAILIFFK